MKEFEQFLEKYVTAINVMFKMHNMRKDCCLAASRIGIDVFQHFGYEAAASTADVMVTNPAYDKMMAKYGKHPENERDAIAWLKRGAFTLYLGAHKSLNKATVHSVPRDKPGWGNHLVITCNDYLIDGSFAQLNRPQKGLPIDGAIWIRRVPGDAAGLYRCKLPFAQVKMQLTDDSDYVMYSDFSSEKNANVVENVIKLMERI